MVGRAEDGVLKQFVHTKLMIEKRLTKRMCQKWREQGQQGDQIGECKRF